MLKAGWIVVAVVIPLVVLAGCPSDVRAQITVSPSSVTLDRPEASQQLLVSESVGLYRSDLTRKVEYSISNPAVIRVTADGMVFPKTDGQTEITVRNGEHEVVVPVKVTGIQQPVPVSFRYEIQPVLTKHRCNSGGCHGKAEGQNGFKLSLFGFDDDADFDALFKQSRGRRVNLAHPDDSLLLMKATARTQHGGGMKLDRDGPRFELLRRWIREGAPFESISDQPVDHIEVEPLELVMRPKESQQLRVTAIDAAGRRQCVTTVADYVSNAPQIINPTHRGIVESSEIPGEATVLVRYLDQVSACRIILPRPHPSVVRPAEKNFIDKHVGDKLVKLGITPSLPIDDATFLRRVSLDTIGTLPTASEAKAFLKDSSPKKRSRLIDSLLNRPEYADYWAMKWADLLRADKIKITPQGTVGMTRWLRKQFATNRPYDEMVAEILTAQGPVQGESPVGFFKSADQPEVAARSVSQLFLGVRIECAQCHHHPSERWSQSDFAGMVGFFTGIKIKRLPNATESLVSKGGSDFKHPRTDQPVPARALGADNADFTNVADRRQILARWITDPSNPFFVRAIVNRLWAHYLGLGLVEPIDDLRMTNPPSNEPLMAALGVHLIDAKFDLKQFTKTILMSQTYQLSSITNEGNFDDRQHFSHARPKALPAEVLLDALSQVTGVPEKFNGWPEGYRSIQVWDNRMPSYFFRVFGRPVRASVCECERSNEPSISQALHLLNSPEINEKITHRRGVSRQLANSAMSIDDILDEIYLSTLSRYPSADERTLLQGVFTASDRQAAVEDVFWSVLNTKEFLFNQ